jgi:hypothetical protein
MPDNDLMGVVVACSIATSRLTKIEEVFDYEHTSPDPSIGALTLTVAL